MKTFTHCAQQGEVRVERIESLPEGMQTAEVEKTQAGGYIISHSEQGNHHVIRDEPGVTVMERTDGVRAGMRTIYAVIDKAVNEGPSALVQDAGSVPHESLELPNGIYKLDISREYDPFAQKARQVAD